MSFLVKSLASGSSGNAFLLRAGATMLLIDAGIAAQTIHAHVNAWSRDGGRLAGILLTHEHSDHLLSAGVLSRQLGVPVVAPAATLDAAEALIGPVERRELLVGQTLDLDDVAVRAFPVPHDAVEPVGFVVQHRGSTVCLATDVGAPVPDLLPHLAAADLLILEANHDVDRLVRGRYPAALKSRILGDRGHLSNAEAGRLLLALGDDRPRLVWLAHLSAANNTPTLAHQTVAAALAAGSVRHTRLDVLPRSRPGATWDAANTSWQLPLF